MDNTFDLWRQWHKNNGILPGSNKSREARLLTERQELDEISYDSIKKVQQFIDPDDLKPYLPFNDLFDGKMRIVIPLFGDTQDTKIMKNIIKMFEINDWKVDLATGMTEREEDYIIPKGPKAGQTIKKKRREKIGNHLKRLHDLAQYFAKDVKTNLDTAAAVKRLNKDFDQQSSEYRRKLLMGSPFEGGIDPWIFTWWKFWNERSELFRKKPEAIKGGYSDKYAIVISRSPVDVLRMADWYNLESCHTEGHQYFHCAIDEAQGHGLIAYVVRKNELEHVNLEDDEIFRDAERDTGVLEPIARVRLRRYVDPEKKYEIAIPEKRVYGDRHKVSGFLESVRKWAQEKQPISKTMTSQEAEKLIRTGGEYQDTGDNELFRKFFEKARIGWGAIQYQPNYNSPADKKYGEAGEKLLAKYNSELPPNIKFEMHSGARTGGLTIRMIITIPNDWLKSIFPGWTWQRWLIVDEGKRKIINDIYQSAPKVDTDKYPEYAAITDLLLFAYNSTFEITKDGTKFNIYSDEVRTPADIRREQDIKDWATDGIDIYKEDIPKFIEFAKKPINELKKVAWFAPEWWGEDDEKSDPMTEWRRYNESTHIKTLLRRRQ